MILVHPIPTWKTQSKTHFCARAAVGRKPTKACMESHCDPCAEMGDIFNLVVDKNRLLLMC